MRHHARIAALIAALVMAIGLTAFTTTVDSSPARQHTPTPTTLAAPTASPSPAMPGESVTLRGSLATGADADADAGSRRTAVLQSFEDNTWRPVQTQPLTASGRYSFEVKQPAWSGQWRVTAPQTEGEGRATQPRTLFAQVQHTTTSLPRSVHVGSRAEITLFASPVRPGRTLTLQRDDGHGWKNLAHLTADKTGHATYSVDAKAPGKTRFRTVARTHRGSPTFVGPAAAVYALEKRPVGVMAWRGDSAHHPENTLDAFRSAVRQRADFIEMDFQPTADGEWVLMHDDDLQRTTDVETRFPDRETASPRGFTLEEIKQLDAGSWKGPRFGGTRVPTIEETFDAIDAAEKRYGHDVRLLVELKGESSAEMRALYRKVVALRPGWVEPRSHDDKAVFMSFDEDHFDFPGAQATGMEQVAVKDEPDPADDYRPGYDQVHLSTDLLDASLVRHYRAQGAKVGTWPAVGTPAVLRAAAAGVDYVTTDDVAKARSALLR